MKHINLFIVVTVLMLYGSIAQGAVVTRTIYYQENGVSLQGYLAYDKNLKRNLFKLRYKSIELQSYI